MAINKVTFGIPDGNFNATYIKKEIRNLKTSYFKEQSNIKNRWIQLLSFVALLLADVFFVNPLEPGISWVSTLLGLLVAGFLLIVIIINGQVLKETYENKKVTLLGIFSLYEQLAALPNKHPLDNDGNRDLS